MSNMTIESHDDDSVTLTVGSITAHISGESRLDANASARVLGEIILGTYEAIEIRTKMAAMRDHLRELDRQLRAAEQHTKGVLDYAYSIREAKNVK